MTYIAEPLRRQVVQRAQDHCEYYHVHINTILLNPINGR